MYGIAPRANDWDPEASRRRGHLRRVQRFERADGHWPHRAAVCSHFGSWNAAIEAAGLISRSSMGGNRAGVPVSGVIRKRISEGTKQGQARAREAGWVQVTHRGPRNPNWRGDDATYSAIHWYLRRYKKWGTCWNCGREGERTQWANVSGKYKRELSDYVELCPSCHKLSHTRGWDLAPIAEHALAAGWYKVPNRAIIGA